MAKPHIVCKQRDISVSVLCFQGSTLSQAVARPLYGVYTVEMSGLLVDAGFICLTAHNHCVFEYGSDHYSYWAPVVSLISVM